MAKLTTWSIFVRAFLLSLLAATPTRVGGQSDSERAAGRDAQQSGTVAAYYGFLAKYPTSTFADEAVDQLVKMGAIKNPPLTRNLGGGSSRESRQAPAKETAKDSTAAEKARSEAQRESTLY